MSDAAGTAPWLPVLAVVAGYLAGSIPFGLLLTRLAGLGDIRRVGSGNIGATNVLRTGNKGLAALTLLLDGGKGALAVLAIEQGGETAGLIAGVAAVIGHNFPLWLRFRGGKGVATTIGVLLALAWPVGMLTCAVWLLTALVSRYSSLAALTALAVSPLLMLALADGPKAIAAFLLAILGFVRHAGNIGRLRRREESKIHLGRRTAAASPAPLHRR